MCLGCVNSATIVNNLIVFKMDTTLKLLDMYGGRDKIMRTCSYVAMFCAGSTRQGSHAQQSCGAVAKSIGQARVVLRLFDDLPTLAANLRYGFGRKEKDCIIRVLTLLGNLSGQFYFIIEHVAWACDLGILRWESSAWWNYCLIIWAVSVSMGILRILHSLNKLSKNDAASSRRRALHQNLIRCSCDLLNAIGWLPRGFLWSGRLSARQSALLGITSSVLGLIGLLDTCN